MIFALMMWLTPSSGPATVTVNLEAAMLVFHLVEMVMVMVVAVMLVLVFHFVQVVMVMVMVMVMVIGKLESHSA